MSLTGAAHAESVIRVGITEDALTMDPANHRRRQTETILRNMYDGLLTRTPRMEVVPELATEVTPLTRLTYLINLNEGVKFHSGEEMTAEDVKFTLERLGVEGAMNGETSPRKSLLPVIKNIEITGRYSLKITLEEPWPNFPAMLPLQQVVSKSFVEGKSLSELQSLENGTGPFRLVEWVPGDIIKMERFPDYYGGASSLLPVGPACVERVEFKVLPDNEERVAALLAGEVDIIDQLPVEDVDEVSKSELARVMKVAGTRTFFIYLNNKKPPFDDLRVRQAMNHAIDRDAIISEILSGNAVKVNGVLGPDAFSFNNNLPAYAYDPALARQLLAEAGYPDGISVEFDSLTALGSTAGMIVDMLGEVGIEARLSSGSYKDLSKKWRDGNGDVGDMWLSSWGNSSLDPVGIFVPTLATGQRGNFAFYSNSEVDALLSAGGSELNRTERAEKYRTAQAIVNQEAPWVFLWVPEELYGVSKRIIGWRPSPDSRINLHDACVR